MKVRPYERWVFHVESESGGPDHRVDLTAYWGNGFCDCHDFQCRHEPAVSRRQKWPSRCKHIKAAREFLLDEILKKEAAKERQCQEGY